MKFPHVEVVPKTLCFGEVQDFGYKNQLFMYLNMYKIAIDDLIPLNVP